MLRSIKQARKEAQDRARSSIRRKAASQTKR
jgi:hypothetical protein